MLVFNTIAISNDVCIVLAVKQRLSPVEQDLLFLTEQLSLLPGFSVVSSAHSLVICVVFYRSLLFALLTSGHCIVCPSLYGFGETIFASFKPLL